jgi:hypothetical protein
MSFITKLLKKAETAFQFPDHGHPAKLQGSRTAPLPSVSPVLELPVVKPAAASFLPQSVEGEQIPFSAIPSPSSTPIGAESAEIKVPSFSRTKEDVAKAVEDGERKRKEYKDIKLLGKLLQERYSGG